MRRICRRANEPLPLLGSPLSESLDDRAVDRAAARLAVDVRLLPRAEAAHVPGAHGADVNAVDVHVLHAASVGHLPGPAALGLLRRDPHIATASEPAVRLRVLDHLAVVLVEHSDAGRLDPRSWP